MKKAVYIFLLLAIPVSVNAYAFMRTLNTGSEGSDVMELQKFLNANPATQIALEGAGSPGNETTYFGERTKQAVVRLQNLFSDTILRPVGLSEGTGFVGNSTLNFLNTSQTNSNPAQMSPPVQNIVIPNGTQATVDSVLPEEIKDGEIITIIGNNFSPTNNTIILGFESKTAYTNIPSTDNGTKIEFIYYSSIQKIYDEKYEGISKKAKDAMMEQFPKIPVAVSVIPQNSVQSNFKIINFILQ